MKIFILSFIILLSGLWFSCSDSRPVNSDYEELVNAFQNPPSEARPKVYWWCLNGNIDTARASQELVAMKEAGITGFDLFEIGVPPQDTMVPAGPAFMSDESVRTIQWVVNKAGKLGLTVGLNLASSWNAGGSWVKPEHGGKSLYISSKRLMGNGRNQTIVLPFPEISFPKESLVGRSGQALIPLQDNGRPVYYEEVTVLAVPVHGGNTPVNPDDILNISEYFDPVTDELSWEVPTGEWDIQRYVCSNSGQQLVLASPHSAGLTIDHFDSVAVETHLMHIINRLTPALGDFRNTALKSFYLASYEARGLVWTPTLPDKFEEITGYEIYKYLPALTDSEIFDSKTSQIFQTHFKKTLSELIINNLYRKARSICNQYGIKINSEAGGPGYPLYNGPAEPLKAQGALDIPRGEFWINHSRFYQDGTDSIDILRVIKEVAAASHIYEKGIVEEEAFTSFQHWQEGPFDMKPYGDRAFCEGMNRVVFHGFSHNITGSGYPGYVYHAGTHFNDKRVWWTKARPFVDYLARLSAVFQNSKFKADVLWYYGDKVPNSARPKNTHFKVGPGYDYEVINTDILLHGLTTKNGKLILRNGAEFEMIVLEDESAIHPGVLKKLEELANQGAVILGERPEYMKQLAAYSQLNLQEDDLISQLWTSQEQLSSVNQLSKGKIYSGISPKEMLDILNVPPDIKYPDMDEELLDFIHYNKNGLSVYFIRNTSGNWIARNVGFRQQNKIPEIWDPGTGEVIPVPIFQNEDQYVTVPLALPPYGSKMVIFSPSTDKQRFTAISDGSIHPPLLEYTGEGVTLLQEGNFNLVGSEGSNSVISKIRDYQLEGPWEVSFTPGWGAPENVVFPELISWTQSENEGIRYYSGNAQYEKTFQIEELVDSGGANRMLLDLGDISKVAHVWLNGTDLGVVWKKPYRYDVSGIVLSGTNKLVIEIANTWSNRLVGDVLTGDDYTNTNIRRTIIPGKPFVPGDQTRKPWMDVPLIESGLFGPVRILEVPIVKISR